MCIAIRHISLCCQICYVWCNHWELLSLSKDSKLHRWHNASVLASSAEYRRSGQTKDYEIGICCFSAKHAALRRKSNDWLARNQDKVSEWGDISVRGLLFQ